MEHPKDDGLLVFWINRRLKNLFRAVISIQRLIREGWVGCASRLGERKGKKWLLPAGGAALEVKHVGIRRGEITTHVILCLRALPLANSTWHVT
jgi:hypothetical protein